MKYLNGSIKNYLKDLSARTPAPGGGSAAALSAAMAAALVAMAVQFTLGKKKYKKIAPDLRAVLAKALRLRRTLEMLCDEDIRAYRSKDFEGAFRVPVQVARLAFEVAALAQEVLYSGNPHLATDAVLAIFLTEAAFGAAVLYVQANMKYLGLTQACHKKVLRDLEAMLPKIKKMRSNAEEFVGTSFGW